jgi:hypothetical protein
MNARMQGVIKHKLIVSVTPIGYSDNTRPEEVDVQSSASTLDGFDMPVVVGSGDAKTATNGTRDQFDSFSSLLLTMRIFGMYFTRKTDGRVSPDKISKKKLKGEIPEVYSAVLMILLWINAIRIMTVLRSDDTALIYIFMGKMVIVTYNVQCAVQQTVFYVACRSGKLDQVLKGVQLGMTTIRTDLRQFVTKVTVFCWICMFCDVFFTIYSVCFSEQLGSVLMTPAANYISFNNLTSIKVIFVIYSVFIQATGIFPIAMTFAISIAFYYKFRDIARRLKNSIRETPALEDAEVEAIRKEHQYLSCLVERADQFLRVYFLVGFFGPMMLTIVVVYIIAFYICLVKNDVMTMVVWMFWLLLNVTQMSLSAVGGILVNYQVWTFSGFRDVLCM